MSKLGMFQSLAEEYEKVKEKKAVCPITGMGADYKPIDDAEYM